MAICFCKSDGCIRMHLNMVFQLYCASFDGNVPTRLVPALLVVARSLLSHIPCALTLLASLVLHLATTCSFQAGRCSFASFGRTSFEYSMQLHIGFIGMLFETSIQDCEPSLTSVSVPDFSCSWGWRGIRQGAVMRSTTML